MNESCGFSIVVQPSPRDESLLEDARDCEGECVPSDGGMLKLTKMGSVLLTVKSGDISSIICDLLNFIWSHLSLVT